MIRFSPLLLVLLLGSLSPFTALAGTAISPDIPVKAGEKVVIDAAGRRIDVSRPFTRVIALYGAHAENLFAMGAGDRLVGVPPDMDWPDEAQGKPVFAYRDDAERLLAVRPDLVLVRPMIERGYPAFVNKLEAAGVTVASLQPVGIDDMLAYWRDLGRLAGAEPGAEDMIRRFTQGVEEVKAEVARVPVEKRVRVYFEAIHDKMKTFAPGSTAMFVLETAGGVNAAADAEQVRETNIAAYARERLMAKGAEIDVYLAQWGRMNPVTPEIIAAEPGFQVIQAVARGRIHLVDEALVARPTPRLLEGIRQVRALLYPSP